MVLCLVGLVDAFDRGVVPAVIEAIQRDLGFSDFEGGLLLADDQQRFCAANGIRDHVYDGLALACAGRPLDD